MICLVCAVNDCLYSNLIKYTQAATKHPRDLNWNTTSKYISMKCAQCAKWKSKGKIWRRRCEIGYKSAWRYGE